MWHIKRSYLFYQNQTAPFYFVTHVRAGYHSAHSS